MGPFPLGIAWLIRAFHFLTVPLRGACLSHSSDGVKCSVSQRKKFRVGANMNIKAFLINTYLRFCQVQRDIKQM